MYIHIYIYIYTYEHIHTRMIYRCMYTNYMCVYTHTCIMHMCASSPNVEEMVKSTGRASSTPISN